jgi:hypothetical protein
MFRSALLTHCGTAQGNPISPRIARVLLDDSAKEMVRRGISHVGHGDEFVIFTKSEGGAEWFFVSVSRYVTASL